MGTVFLALVVFAELGQTPPLLIRPFASIDECIVAATKMNSGVLTPPPKEGTGYVCFSMRGSA